LWAWVVKVGHLAHAPTGACFTESEDARRPDADSDSRAGVPRRGPDSRGSASPRRGSKGVRGLRGSQSPVRSLPGGDPRDSSGNPRRKGGCPSGAGGGRLPERCPEAAAEPDDAEQMLETSAGACTRLFKIGFSGGRERDEGRGKRREGSLFSFWFLWGGETGENRGRFWRPLVPPVTSSAGCRGRSPPRRERHSGKY